MTRLPRAAASTPTTRRPRSFARDGLGLVWLVAAVVIALVQRNVPDAPWLMVHLVLLGALTHAILVWSAHFAAALLRTVPDPAAHREAAARLWLHAGGALAVFVGVPAAHWGLVVAGATTVAAVVAWHGAVLAVDLRRALPGRFRVTLRYYLAAAACLPVSAGLGAALAFGLDDTTHARFLVAHSLVTLLGWVGLTVAGTLVTLWPTVLRTRLDDRADRLARQALPLLAASVVAVVVGPLTGTPWVTVGALAAYLGGVLWWGRALVRPARTKPPRSFAAASLGAALVWFVVALLWAGTLIATSPTPTAMTAAYPTLAGVFVVGFAAQLLAGALAYLVPSVIGGGPAGVWAGNARFDQAGGFRLLVTNAGLTLFLLPVPSWMKVTTSAAVLGALAWFLVAFARAVRAVLAARAEQATPRPAEPPERVVTPAPLPDRTIWTRRQLGAALATLALALTAGVAVDPGAAGLPGWPSRLTAPAAVAPSGQTTRVTVTAHGMTFTPRVVDVPAGNRLVIELVNADPTTVHDLAVGDVRTPRLAPGERADLDVGVPDASTQGWCTVVGHRQHGMVVDIRVGGKPVGAGVAPTASDHTTQTTQATPADPAARLERIVDAVLPPLTAETIHRRTLTVTEVPLEVAPGVWQQRWTFDGGPVGPTLHGRVGDVFEITLVNDGTLGHSIDFHAGALAPDRPMRTIPPGDSLTYRFTATRAGIWMYHCSTHPMSAHIAAGMHGAVVIEPPGLPAVDRAYVLVQSEVFLGHQTGRSAPDEVNADAVVAERPSYVVFNGVANQYDQQPFAARVGERVRFWVLAAGPNRAASFHVVGGQFDTMYLEGAYTLRNGRDAFGHLGSGAQALGLHPAQGGFVEIVFGEPGNYPAVSHVMVDAERGAHGVVHVTPAP